MDEKKVILDILEADYIQNKKINVFKLKNINKLKKPG